MSQYLYSNDQLIEAIRQSRGRIRVAARSLGCTVNVFHDRRKVSREVDDAIREAREELVDLAEESLVKLLEEHDFRAINLVLRTLGKDRGYVERIETVSISDEALDQEIAKERAKLAEAGGTREPCERDALPAAL